MLKETILIFAQTKKIRHFTSLHHFSSNNQKTPTENITHWLELITEIASFLQIFSVRKKKNNHSGFFDSSENLQENQKNKLYFRHILHFHKQITDN